MGTADVNRSETKELVSMRRGIALVWLAATAVVTGVIATAAYQAGWAAGAAARLPAGAAAPYYFAPHPFFGFGFGFLPFLLLLAVLFFAFRAVRWGRWGRGPGGWGPPGGWGYGRYPGAGGPGGSQPGAGAPNPGEAAPGAPSGADDPLHGWPQRPPEDQPERKEL
jgi:hypothetical protein